MFKKAFVCVLVNVFLLCLVSCKTEINEDAKKFTDVVCQYHKLMQLPITSENYKERLYEISKKEKEVKYFLNKMEAKYNDDPYLWEEFQEETERLIARRSCN